jgi:Holliday junction DNA helicase RuvA
LIAHLRGRLLSLTPEEVVLDVGGVGYQLQIPLSTYYRLEGLLGDQDVALFVYTHVREDTISLFGFTSPDERRLFERLIGVSGIGPKLGRVILSGLAPGDLVAALESGDAARLATTPGVGKKTAERMILELRDKVADLRSGPAEVAPRASSADDELLAALESLGYRPREAERALAAVAEEAPDAELGVRLRLALKQLSKI